MPDNIRILLLSIVPPITQSIKTLLASYAFAEFLPGDINNAESAIDAVRLQQPDIILLETDFPGWNFLIELIRKEAPHTQVIVLAEIVSADAVRMAMRAGAYDFLSYKTSSSEELIGAIEYAARLSREEKERREVEDRENKKLRKKPETHKRAQIVAFYSPKGGAGVSTLVVNTALALHEKGKKVLIVDACLQYGDVALLLTNQAASRTIADIAEKGDEIDSDVVERVRIVGKVDILPAPQLPEQALRITGPVFARILKIASELVYDIILVNTSSYISDPCFAALEMADIILLVLLQEVAAIRASRAFLNLIKNAGLGQGKVLMLVNKFQEESGVTLKRINEILETKITITIPPDPVTVTRADDIGIPFVVEHPDLPISKSVARLADELQSALAQIPTQLVAPEGEEE
jgi:pilus assembly protein CpaE